MRKIAIILMVVLTISAVCFAEDTQFQKTAEKSLSSKHEDIKRLLVLTGEGELAIQTMKFTINLKLNNSELKANYSKADWDNFTKIFIKTVTEEVDFNSTADILIPIYDKYFTHENIKKLIKFYNSSTVKKFYRSPVGKKLVSVQPKIIVESMLVGKKRGGELGEKALQKALDKLEKKKFPKQKEKEQQGISQPEDLSTVPTEELLRRLNQMDNPNP